MVNLPPDAPKQDHKLVPCWPFCPCDRCGGSFGVVMLGVEVLEPAAKNGAKCRHRPGAKKCESGRTREKGSRQQRAVSCCHDAACNFLLDPKARTRCRLLLVETSS